MGHSIESIRLLAERYFKGETTLEEESALRNYFAGCGDIPADLRPCALLFGHWAGAAAEKSRREIPVREPRAVPRLRIAVTATIAFAAAMLVGVFITVNNVAPIENDIVCYVNGQPITDHEQAAERVRDAFEVINSNLRKPTEIISSQTGNASSMNRVGEMLNSLVNEE